MQAIANLNLELAIFYFSTTVHKNGLYFFLPSSQLSLDNGFGYIGMFDASEFGGGGWGGLVTLTVAQAGSNRSLVLASYFIW